VAFKVFIPPQTPLMNVGGFLQCSYLPQALIIEEKEELIRGEA